MQIKTIDFAVLFFLISTSFLAESYRQEYEFIGISVALVIPWGFVCVIKAFGGIFCADNHILQVAAIGFILLVLHEFGWIFFASYADHKPIWERAYDHFTVKKRVVRLCNDSLHITMYTSLAMIIIGYINMIINWLELNTDWFPRFVDNFMKCKRD